MKLLTILLTPVIAVGLACNVHAQVNSTPQGQYYLWLSDIEMSDFVKVDSCGPGESVIPLGGWDWSASSPFEWVVGADGAGKPDFTDVELITTTDVSQLMEYVANGEQISTATIYKCGPKLNEPVLTLNGVIVSAVSIDGVGDRPLDIVVNLRPSEFEFCSLFGDSSSTRTKCFGWNIRENKER